MPLGPLVALVGPNGAGKSAILRAIDMVVGMSWPTLQRIRLPHDFTAYDDSREMYVKVSFDEPLVSDPDKLGTRHNIHSLRVRCRPYKRRTGNSLAGDPNFDYDPLDVLDDVPLECLATAGGRPSMQRPLRVSTRMRESAMALLIDHRRAVAQHHPGVRGSILTRLLAPAIRDLEKPHPEADDGRSRRSVFEERFEHAAEVLRTPYVQELEATVDETTRRALGFAGGQARNARVAFKIADPVNPYSSLRLVYSEEGVEFPGDQVGLGVQSAMVVGIFEALRAQRSGTLGTVLIDEPEMYLHPHAQRHFYAILREIAERGDAQVVYSTHSSVFADATRFEALRLVRRPAGGSSSATFVRDEDRAQLEDARGKLETEYDATRSEALFADAVLLVEGKADLVAVQSVASRLQLDLDGCNLSVLECGGKTSIPFHARACRALEIPVCALYDDDNYDLPDDADDSLRKKLVEENARAQRESAAIEAALGPENRFVCEPSLEALVGIGRNASEKPRKMKAIVRGMASRKDVPPPLLRAVLRLAELAEVEVPLPLDASQMHVSTAD